MMTESLRRGRTAGLVPNLAAAIGLGAALFSPAAAAQCAQTASQTEGPYYRTPNPETTNVRIPGDGPLLTLQGQVAYTDCSPIPYAWVAVWHADPNGTYDNTPPYDRYRCYFFSDDNGQFSLDTILPGLYPGRTRHIHVKVDAPNTAVLTTQLYFPGEPQNESDPFYDPALEMTLTQNPDGSFLGSFGFRLPNTGGCTPPTVTVDPSPVTALPGGTASFSVGAAGGEPWTYRWRRNGAPLQNGEQISGVTTNQLSLTSVTCHVQGLYDCVVLNACGTDASATARLTISDSACLRGNLNCDGAVDFSDIDPFVLALSDPSLYAEMFPDCNIGNADINFDDTVDFLDIEPFVTCLGEGCP